MKRTSEQFKTIQHIRQVCHIKGTATAEHYPRANERELLTIKNLAARLELALGNAAKLNPGERDESGD